MPLAQAMKDAGVARGGAWDGYGGFAVRALAVGWFVGGWLVETRPLDGGARVPTSS